MSGLKIPQNNYWSSVSFGLEGLCKKNLNKVGDIFQGLIYTGSAPLQRGPETQDARAPSFTLLSRMAMFFSSASCDFAARHVRRDDYCR